LNIFGVVNVKFFAACLALVFLLISLDAEAGRLAGGRKMGRQSSNVGQQSPNPSAPPAAPAQQSVQRPTPPAPVAQPAPRRPWGAMLGGLAAGLGLAWLAHSLGLGAAFGNMLMIALLAMVVMGVIGWLMRRRAEPAVQQPFAVPGGSYSPGYRPENVGNDSSARPYERSFFQPEAEQGSMIGSALTGSQAWGVPAGFDTEGFLAACKRNFVSLQAAWDHSDVSALRAFMTDGMLSEITTQLAERDTHTGTPVNVTEVVMLDARLLGIEETAVDYLASVEFSGMIRENPSTGPAPFREVWNMSKPKDGSAGWLVAGVQALQ